MKPQQSDVPLHAGREQVRFGFSQLRLGAERL
jgi:hypothetical protein